MTDDWLNDCRVFVYRCNVCGKDTQHRQPKGCSAVAFCVPCGWGSRVPDAVKKEPTP